MSCPAALRRAAPLTALALAVCLPSSAGASGPGREQIEFFEKSVRPVLAERCFSCHSQAAGKVKGGLALDTAGGLAEGGDSGPAVTAGDPDNSKLIEAVRYHDEDLKMPPKGKIPDAEIDVLVRWVKAGAAFPKSEAKATAGGRAPGKITDEDRQWWAFQPVRPVTPPAVGDGWARNEVDRFVAAGHATAKLTPAPEAPRAALIRRLSFDLHGLPPTPQDVDAFVNDPAPDAHEKLVEKMLASPRYGERWARHWLDLVRYADSDGYRIDDYRPHAFRFRDYVIRSFNADKPYDRFVKEQLAGDELFPGDPEALVATGYLRHWIYEYNNRDVRGQWSVILNDVTDTTSDVFLGLGMQCARCHDHKFDPILQKDYYRLQTFFANILPRDDQTATTEKQRAEYAAKLKVWEDKTTSLRAEIDDIERPYREKAAKGAVEKFPEDIQALIHKPVPQREPLEHQLAELAYRQVDYEYGRLERTFKSADKEKVLALRRKLAEFDALKPAPLPVAFAASDVGPSAPPTFVPKKGNTPVEPGFLTLLDANPAAVEALPNSSGRRSTLAKWLTKPDHPLTARVIVNRVWQQHFGRGLAANASDFGRLGEKPTHPELLDWLAARFVADGWSIKSLHRLVVNSAAYRQSSDHPDAARGRLTDPENRLLWRGGVRRLDAEQVRDALYAVTGELDLKAGGPGAGPTEPRRSVFTKAMRNTRDPLLDVFDAPLPFNSAASRDTTTTPVQSLLMINGPQVLARARALAARLAKEEPDEARRVERAYRLAFGRPPSADEVSAARAFLGQQSQQVVTAGASASALATGKLPYRDGQAAEVRPEAGPAFEVPHSERLPRGDFTVEAFVYPRSVADSGTVRTVAAKGSSDIKQPGWAFGVTGKKSRRKPQTVVLQLVGTKRDGSVGEEAVFSDQHVQLNKPYYLAAAVRLATDKAPGRVSFYLKDLSNDDEPLLTANLSHSITGGLDNELPLTLGGRSGARGNGFDGLIDDVRLSDAPLGVGELLFTQEGTNKHTAGYWPFENRPGVLRDASGHGLDVRLPAVVSPAASKDARAAAWADFCHVLLNSNEFLYVE